METRQENRRQTGVTLLGAQSLGVCFKNDFYNGLVASFLVRLFSFMICQGLGYCLTSSKSICSEYLFPSFLCHATKHVFELLDCPEQREWAAVFQTNVGFSLPMSRGFEGRAFVGVLVWSPWPEAFRSSFLLSLGFFLKDGCPNTPHRIPV